MSNLDFAALLCSRLCHDLVSPVGAINNGLEILEDEKDPSMREAVLDLITASTRQTANKLQFFRLAFGAAGGFSSQLDLREAEKAFNLLLDGSRTALNWKVTEPSGSKNLVKLLLNVGLVVSECLIRGGTLTIKMDKEDNQLRLVVAATGGRVILQDVVKDALLGKLSEAELEPRTAPAYLAAQVAGELGGALVVVQEGEESLIVKAVIDSMN
ncbi:MAG: histidine phosphotransferase [Kordiimonadales bacterium]|nr:MAG: histidine phosphotransferase [Kordiimonadales bacterium]